ncbi:Unknown protein [Striga hermonthica]|uniref:Uncharacterized protein n=1 Tax=Striga hermonthica TaxID=68872 RepID=A0A9N7RRY1_STRHE|nr:Unknown protein [Striga hermonthica]
MQSYVLHAWYGKLFCAVLEGPREVTPAVLESSTGLEVSKFSPKKWGLSGSSSLLVIALFAGVSILLNQGIDIRPNLAAILGLSMLDAIFLGGSCLAQISCYWPPYKRRILVHEAGHLLVAYLMGCPIRGVILDPFVAMQMGIQGQHINRMGKSKDDHKLNRSSLSPRDEERTKRHKSKEDDRKHKPKTKQKSHKISKRRSDKAKPSISTRALAQNDVVRSLLEAPSSNSSAEHHDSIFSGLGEVISGYIQGKKKATVVAQA